MKRNHPSMRKIALLAFGLAACGAPAMEAAEAEPESSTPLIDRLNAIHGDLLPGSEGDGVRAVHDYLTAFGYFPNAALARAYPEWRPVVATPPASRSIFDEHTVKAVQALQANTGLTITGIVDKETLALMQAPRCGAPDGIRRPDPSEKFARFGSKWSGEFLFWKVTNTDGDLPLATVEEAARQAFARWQAQTNLAFLQLPQGRFGADILITFTPPVVNQGALAETAEPAQGGDMKVNPAVNWSVSDPTPPGFVDLRMVLTHEIGHALGLRHSAHPDAVMHMPTWVLDLGVDDMVGISSIYDKWTTLPGAAMDIGANASGAVWVLGTGAPGQADFPVYQWNGSNWDWDRADGWGTRITVDRDGRPWVVNSEKRIWRRSNNSALSGIWEEVLGLHATDIAAEGGNVWAISDQTAWGNDFKIFQWIGGSSWVQSDGGAFRVGIGSSGVPWVIDAGGYIYRRTSSGATSGTWQLMTGAANDISIGPYDNAFVVGTSAVPSVGSVWVYNEQSGLGDPPDVAEWINLSQNSTAIAVGQNGRPWVVGPNHEILTVTK